MISRRRILSRSRGEVFNDYNPFAEEEGVWYSKEKLFKDHIQEIYNKWEQIDDEIWAKIICMNSNRRVAKAYARAPILTINGSQDGFDGYRIGLNGFENPHQDIKTEEVMRYIGKGCRIKIEESGNIVIKRYSRCCIYVKGFQNEFTDCSVSNEIIKNNGLLELQKPCLLFDMMKFETNMSRELRSSYPNRKKLENQCISCIAFVKDSPNILDLPCYVMIINIVALDLLKSKITQIPNIASYTIRQKVPDFVSLFDRSKQMSDEDPYSLPANGSSNDSNYYANNGTLLKKSTLREPKPPKLPPRDFGKYKAKNRGTVNKIEIPTPDYSHDEDIFTMSKSSSKKLPSFYDRDEDPYYCGMQARVTKFVKPLSTQSKKSVAWRQMRKVFSSGYINTLLPPLSKKKRSKSYYYSNYNSSESDPYATLNDPYEIYEPIYGKVGTNNYYPSRTYAPSTVRSKAYISEWDNHY